MSVGVMTVGEITVGVMRRPRIENKNIILSVTSPFEENVLFT